MIISIYAYHLFIYFRTLRCIGKLLFNMKKNNNNEIEFAKLDLIRHLKKVVKDYNDNLSELKELEEKEEMVGLSREEKGRMRDIKMNHPKNNAIINRGLFLMYYGIDPFSNMQIVEDNNGYCKIVCLSRDFKR